MNESLLEEFSAIYYQNGDFDEQEPALRQLRAEEHLKLLQRLLREPLVEVTKGKFAPDRTVIMVATPDRPFLIDSLRMALDEEHLVLHKLMYQVMTIDRDSSGNILNIYERSSDENDERVSIIYGEIDQLDSPKELAEKLHQKVQLLNLLAEDFPRMSQRLEEVVNQLEAIKFPPKASYDQKQVGDFLRWLLNDNFTFLGFRAYEFQEGDLKSVAGSGLGLLRQEGGAQPSASFSELPAALKAELLKPEMVLISKSNHISPVHRPVYMDFIGIQRYNLKGELVGEWRLLGLFTASAYQLPVQEIPLLRDKAKLIKAKSGYIKGGYRQKRLDFLLNEFPREEFFQWPLAELYPTFKTLVNLVDGSRLRLFRHIDHYQRFVSALVYVPRDKFNTENREKLLSLLALAYKSEQVKFTPHFSNQFVRVAFHIRTTPGQVAQLDLDMLEEALNNVISDWNDEFAQLSEKPELRALAKAMGGGYREKYTPEEALPDMAMLYQIQREKLLPQVLVPKIDVEHSLLTVKVLGGGAEYSPSAVLPLMEQFGLKVEHLSSYPNQQGFWLQVYDLSFAGELKRFDEERFREALGHALHHGSGDNFNQLIITTKLTDNEVLVLRALGRYMQQAAVPFSADYIQRAVNDNPAIAEALLRYFRIKFDPRQKDRDYGLSQEENAINEALQLVSSLDEDRILRWFFNLMRAMVRTNYYQHGRLLPLAFKFSARHIEELPQPKPLFEIFVYGDDVEGVHLRGGKVARGGLRWSDRQDDYRTEILGLVKAQMVKNTIIVPVGSKGGFIVRKASANREEFLKQGQECYKRYIGALLTLTDNLVDGQVVPPPEVVRYDEDDPYLVVAADKGTASFSNLANGVAADFNFWLGDAFASGGSAGYDHKAMGITARGAWESVKRHFRHLGKDIQNRDEINVVGIGDMSGDVFGNGMLQSRKIRLQAAFNHLHIFIDPSPDPEKSYRERERLFRLPRSSWLDYDKALISKGGGCFSRSDKVIDITPEMRVAFDISEEKLSPNELIKKLLGAPVDLIWNGGIGTYIKHSEETNLQVGDRNNDRLRISGNEVRAKVIGEGGNLGMTQRGRIEAGLNGVRLYSDAIDNSGGVNCSDHEVNIKILLNQVFKAEEVGARNELLASMTDEVAQLVLRQNYLQPQIIEQAMEEPLSQHVRLIQQLEREGLLDRALEFLPKDEELQQREHLTRSELAVLLAYVKMRVYDQLLNSDLADNDYLQEELKHYFPQQLAAYGEAMAKHPLRREIICTYLTNDLVNHMGLGFLSRMQEESGCSAADIAQAYWVARAVFNAEGYWQRIDIQDNLIAAERQVEMHRQVRRLLESGTLWFLDQFSQLDVAGLIQSFRPQVKALIGGNWFKEKFAVQGSDLSAEMVLLPHYVSALDIVLLAQAAKVELAKVGDLYSQLDQRLHGSWFREQIANLPGDSFWDKQVQRSMLQHFGNLLRQLAQRLLDSSLKDWEGQHGVALARLDEQLASLQERPVNLAVLSVLLDQLHNLA